MQDGGDAPFGFLFGVGHDGSCGEDEAGVESGTFQIVPAEVQVQKQSVEVKFSNDSGELMSVAN